MTLGQSRQLNPGLLSCNFFAVDYNDLDILDYVYRIAL